VWLSARCLEQTPISRAVIPADPVKLTDGPLTRNVQASDRFTMKTISRADAAWHILSLAEDPAPGRSGTPVITTGADREPRPAQTEDPDLSARQAPTR
jgi:hypothetical protein